MTKPSRPRTEHRLSDAWIDFACVPLSFSHKSHLRESADTPDIALRSRRPFLSLTSTDSYRHTPETALPPDAVRQTPVHNPRCRHSGHSHQRTGVAVPDGASQVCAYAATGYALTGVCGHTMERSVPRLTPSPVYRRRRRRRVFAPVCY